MLYSDADITQALKDGTFVIDGMAGGSLQPASVDFHLSGRPLKVWAHHGLVSLDEGIAGTYVKRLPYIVPWRDQSDEMSELPFRQPFGDLSADPVAVLAPGQFALASTIERVTIGPTVAGRLEGKSSLARLGLVIHTTAGFFDPGFEGYPTLELVNLSPRPMALRPGMPIAQMSFFALQTPCERPYSVKGHYAEQGADPEPSHYYQNFEGDQDG